MEYPIPAAGFENRNLVLKSAGVFSGAQIWIDGAKAPKGPKRGTYSVKRNDGRELAARIKPSLDPIPNVEIDGTSIQIAEPLHWYQWVWSAIPIVLLFMGGAIGGGLGAFAVMLNARVFRSEAHPASKYFLTAIISLGVFAIFTVFAVLINGAVSK